MKSVEKDRYFIIKFFNFIILFFIFFPFSLPEFILLQRKKYRSPLRGRPVLMIFSYIFI